MNGDTSNPRNQVFGNSLIMEQIYSTLAKKDIKKCLALGKAGFANAAKGLYKEVPEDMHKRLANLDCPYVRNNIYLAATSSVKLSEAHLPINVPVQALQNRFPNLMAIKFDLPYERMAAEISRDSAQGFTELSVWCGKRQKWNEVNLQMDGFGLIGSTAKFRLVSLRVYGSLCSASASSWERSSEYDPLPFLGTMWISLHADHPIKPVLGDLRKLELTSTVMQEEAIGGIIPYLMGVESLKVAITSDYKADTRLYKLVADHCQQIKDLSLCPRSGNFCGQWPCVAPFAGVHGSKLHHISYHMRLSSLMYFCIRTGTDWATQLAGGTNHTCHSKCVTCAECCLGSVSSVDILVNINLEHVPNDLVAAASLRDFLGIRPLLRLAPMEYFGMALPTIDPRWGRKVADLFDMLKHAGTAQPGYKHIRFWEVERFYKEKQALSRAPAAPTGTAPSLAPPSTSAIIANHDLNLSTSSTTTLVNKADETDELAAEKIVKVEED